jgi:hypothetical protein
MSFMVPPTDQDRKARRHSRKFHAIGCGIYRRRLDPFASAGTIPDVVEVEVPNMEWRKGARYRIVYRSESGGVSERVVDVLDLRHATAGALYIRAFCHLRGQDRTFCSDRVLSASQIEAPARTATSSASARASEPAAPARVPMYSAPAYAAASYTAPPDQPRKIWKDLGAKVLGYVIGIPILVVFLANTGFFDEYQQSQRMPDYSTSAYALPPPKPAAAAPSALKPQPSIDEVRIGGKVLRTVHDGAAVYYEVPELGLRTHNKREAVFSIRFPAFKERTGLSDSDLLARYLGADLDGSGKLSFEELRVFQKKTYQEFRYEANRLALRPDQFLTAGSGDCEDFALYSAGLLRFWGWEPYLGSLGPAQGGTGHAVCLSFEGPECPAGFAYFEVVSGATEDGTTLPTGRYVPIDYDQVGSLTNAVEKGWKLREVYLPEKAWGRVM